MSDTPPTEPGRTDPTPEGDRPRNARPRGPVPGGTARATSFGAAAGAYERGRPEYRPESVAWMVGDATEIVDVGAGTGKLTAAVAALGRRVTAVDPDPAMLDALRHRLPAVETHGGTAEAIPRPDASADAVVCGQAWHWVDPTVACTEVARVLRPGGTLGIIWNVRDARHEANREFTAITGPSPAEEMVAAGGPVPHPPFDAFEAYRDEWVRTLSVDDVVDMAASRSGVITLDDAARRRVLAEVRAWAERQADAAGIVAIGYVTAAFRAVPTTGAGS